MIRLKSILVLLNHSAYDIDLIEGLEAWLDSDASDDSDGDGITTGLNLSYCWGECK